MIGLGEVSPVSLVEGKLQAEVGKFLMMKQVLVKLQTDASFDIRKEANLLMNEQYKLEQDLQTGLNIINAMKTGSYVISDIARVGNIAFEINNHTKKVQALQEKSTKAGSVQLPSTLPISTMTLVGLGAAALGIWVYSRRK